MINVETVFNIGNLVGFIGTILLIYAVIKNRNVLKDFHPLGSMLNFIAVLFFTFNYYQLCIWISFWFCLTSVVLWLMVSFYSIKNWLKNRKDGKVRRKPK